jgi:hypothetical protein
VLSVGKDVIMTDANIYFQFEGDDQKSCIFINGDATPQNVEFALELFLKRRYMKYDKKHPADSFWLPAKFIALYNHMNIYLGDTDADYSYTVVVNYKGYKVYRSGRERPVFTGKWNLPKKA